MHEKITFNSIALFLIIIGICGITAEFSIFFDLDFKNRADLFEFNRKFFLLKTFYFDLGVFNYNHNISWWQKIDTEKFGIHFPLNLINVYFYLILIISGLIFWISREKIKGFVLFLYSYFLLKGLFSVFSALIFLIIEFSKNSLEAKNLNFIVASLFLNGFLVFFSVLVIKKLLSGKELELNEINESLEAIETSKKMRFINLVFDFILIFYFTQTVLSIFEQAIYLLKDKQEFKRFEVNTFGITIIFVRFIYYWFFESTLGYSPAKFITQSRVASNDLFMPSVSKVFIRTISRLIPFEGISFLGKTGWHDRFSKTLVLKEKNSGANPLIFLGIFLIPFLVPL
jgi:hypothetical protein